MSRPLRIEFPGAVYHVIARGVARTRTFIDAEDYFTFLRLLGDLVSDLVLIVYCFCLMPNHPHILCQTPRGGLHKWMRQLFGEYAREYNRRHARSGHLWQARYRGLLVDDGDYLVDCSRYIHLNPCKNKRLVRSPELWPWSSYANYVGGTVVAPWVCTEPILSHLGSREKYRDFVMAGLKEKLVSPFERAVGGIVYGGEDFVAKIREMEKARRHRSEVSGRRPLLSTEHVSPDLLAHIVDEQFPDLSDCKKRQILGYALHRYTLMPNTEIAQLLKRHPSSISNSHQRVAKRVAMDPDLKAQLESIESQFAALQNRTMVERLQLKANL